MLKIFKRNQDVMFQVLFAERTLLKVFLYQKSTVSDRNCFLKIKMNLMSLKKKEVTFWNLRGKNTSKSLNFSHMNTNAIKDIWWKDATFWLCSKTVSVIFHKCLSAREYRFFFVKKNWQNVSKSNCFAIGAGKANDLLVWVQSLALLFKNQRNGFIYRLRKFRGMIFCVSATFCCKWEENIIVNAFIEKIEIKHASYDIKMKLFPWRVGYI